MLAFLRFAFCAGVFAQHMGSYAPHPITRYLTALGGFPGVAGFLLISGFSIHASLARETSGYLKRRVFRIFPVYVVACLASLIPFLVLGSRVFDGMDVIPAPLPLEWLATLLMLGPYLPLRFPANGPLWTVQVEFAFYLLAPWLARMEQRWVNTLLVVSAIAYALFPYLAGRVSIHTSSYGVEALTLLWIWLLGWQLYRWRGKPWCMVAAFLFTAAMFIHWQGDERYGLARMAPPLIAVIGLGGALHGLNLDARLTRLLNWLGDLSYEIYALHIPVAIFLFSATRSTNILLYAVASLAVSAIVLHLVDRPMRALGRSRHAKSV